MEREAAAIVASFAFLIHFLMYPTNIYWSLLSPLPNLMQE